MQTENDAIQIVNCHAAGEVGDVIVAGVEPPLADSIWDQSRIIANDQTLRNFVLNEPRGNLAKHVNLLVPPKNQTADFGFIIMEPEDTPPMSGSNTICVATVILETGLVKATEPQTKLVLEAPGGLVEVIADCNRGKVTKVHLRNVASFVERRNATLKVDGMRPFKVDVAFGGDSFVIVDARSLGFAIVPTEARKIAELGIKITNAANEQLGFSHPTLPDWKHISFCMMTLPMREENGKKIGRHAVAIQPGKLDRCPTGTGCSARLALMHANGEIAVDEVFYGESLIDSQFECKILKETKLSRLDAIIPQISGTAWITGKQEIYRLESDPFPAGYRLSDTWPTKNN